MGLFGFAGCHCLYMLLGAGDFYRMLPITACTGLLGAAFTVIPTSMLADIADLDTLESGEDRAAWYFAVWSFIVKLGSSVGPSLAFALLALVGYQASEGAQNTQDGILGLRMLYSFGPAVGMAICALVAWNYPLTRTRHAEIREHTGGCSQSRIRRRQANCLPQPPRGSNRMKWRGGNPVRMRKTIPAEWSCSTRVRSSPETATAT